MTTNLREEGGTGTAGTNFMMAASTTAWIWSCKVELAGGIKDVVWPEVLGPGMRPAPELLGRAVDVEVGALDFLSVIREHEVTTSGKKEKTHDFASVQ